ncbi:MAG: hypothetical protein QOH91_3663 [Mycobacterium sp.]|jgi:hypothetical protein|nr:hypothetical protein [Mycobacterium sp.]
MAKMGELKRAAQLLGVGTAALRQQGWSTASPARVEATMDDPPDWLIAARQNRRKKDIRQHRRRETRCTARRLGIAVHVVKERGITPAEVAGLLAAQPDWLVAAQQRQHELTERRAKDELHGALTDSLIASVHDGWFQELKHAAGDDDLAAIDARWAPEVGRAKGDARRLVNELSPEQIQAGIDREAQAAHAAARYRAARLLDRALRGDGGRAI